MKILFIILALVILSNCASQTSADKIENDTARPKPTVNNSNNANVNNWKPIQNEANKIDENKQKELDDQNEKFRQVPDEFIKIDFKNFKYPYARLKNGEYIEERKNRSGGTTYSFDDVFFINLNGDKKKEAVVMLYAVSCGGSCDGGKSIVHFYSSEKSKPKLLDWIELGSRSGGCSLKSLKIVNKKIFIEQFGKCSKNSSYEENRVYSCKFCIKDLTCSVYTIKIPNFSESQVRKSKLRKLML
ncbi:MAG: hypothetical protein M3388_16730 [Acidobacteriota bacterium]|nr:hypothetical protein [Acidobacteriota bacterium]